MSIGFKRGIFGTPPYNTPPTWGGPSLEGDEQTVQSPEKNTGFFGQGGAGRNIAGYIGDYLLQSSGMQPIYQPAMQFDRAMAKREQMAAQQRQAAMQDWITQQRWKRENPEPQQPDMFTRMMTGGGIDPNSQEGRELYRQRAETMANPMKMVIGPDGKPYFINPQQQGGQLPSFTQDDWDNAGGGTSNGANGFRY